MDDDDIQRQVKSLYCAANKLRGTFDQCSPAVKNTLFRAYCMPMYACQLWSKYTQTSMKRLRAAYSNAYRIMYYIPRNVSVRPHQVSLCVRIFDAVLRNNLYRFFMRCASVTQVMTPKGWQRCDLRFSRNYLSMGSHFWTYVRPRRN